MKQLLIIRHAKSSWDYSILNDFDRPLNERGHHDAMMMATRLIEKKIKIDAFISSPANRALTTATYFAEAFGEKEKNIIKVAELYHAPADVFYDVISKANDVFNSIAIFSHNPGITEFVNELTSRELLNMPTCGIFAVKANVSYWKLFPAAKKEFL
ncbi:MAG TPA: histidine phosphatase family protein, partial [Chitinophagaceae bacterium]|nr:histidine phosphatase family protein [Chitinophagaceae bacterium]